MAHLPIQMWRRFGCSETSPTHFKNRKIFNTDFPMQYNKAKIIKEEPYLHKKLWSICVFASIGHWQQVLLIVFNSKAFIWRKKDNIVLLSRSQHLPWTTEWSNNSHVTFEKASIDGFPSSTITCASVKKPQLNSVLDKINCGTALIISDSKTYERNMDISTLFSFAMLHKYTSAF